MEVERIKAALEEAFDGEPWYGKSFLAIVKTVDESITYIKPADGSHSMIEVLYHMLNWQEFALHQLEDSDSIDPERYQSLDWRETNPELHTWNTGLSEFTAGHNKIVHILENSTDELMEKIVRFRDYSFSFLLNGLIQHNIYHNGQLAYINKLLSK